MWCNSYFLLAMAVKAEIKDESKYIKNQPSTYLDQGDLRTEPEVMAVKTEIKEDDSRYIENQLSTSIDLGVLKSEADEYNSGSSFYMKISLFGDMVRTVNSILQIVPPYDWKGFVQATA
uniref:Uncharacterized protein LOC114348270 n=1 Tax=Diabrotica virgifera virgifera TaxID=50390 RepID=A0A6P7GZ22_DIAVI